MKCIGMRFGLLLPWGAVIFVLWVVSGRTAAQNPSQVQGELQKARALSEQLKARLAATEAALAKSQAVAASLQNQAEALRKQADDLQQQLQQGQAERDKNLTSVVELTDQLHNAFNQIKQLKAENNRLKAWLPPPPPNGLEGLVIANPKNGLVEISLGSDDGLKPGHQLSVFRAKGTAINLLGQIGVVKVTADKAICRVGAEAPQGAIQKGDRVTTGTRPAPPSPAEPPKPGEPPLLIGGTVLAVLEDSQVEISFGAADGLQAGHGLEVYRQTGGQGIYVGRVEVVQAGPKKSRCKIVLERDTVRQGDRVISKL